MREKIGRALDFFQAKPYNRVVRRDLGASAGPSRPSLMAAHRREKDVLRRRAPYICIRICFCADFFVQQGSFRAVPMSGWKNANTASIEIKMQTIIVFLREKAFGMEKSKKPRFYSSLDIRAFLPFSDFSAKACKNAEECGIL
ncbi:MAG: hypothetical protein IJZ24_04350 [Clostridia bacterium]|nr:hypothetical protein [Clostridia bacterium]